MKRNFTIKKVTEVLGISRSVVYRLIEKGELIAWKCGSAKRVTEESVEVYRDKKILRYAATNEIPVSESVCACHAVLNKLKE